MRDYVCCDLLFLILKWFTVEALVQCRCVCKSWKELIDSTSFILDHLALQRPRILLQQKQSFEYLLLDPCNLPLYDTLRGPHDIEAAGGGRILYAVSCVHGVICLYDENNLLLLWNPSIHRHLRIPLPEFPLAISVRCTKLCGFWIDPLTKEFKVVIFCYSKQCVALFSSEKRAWTQIACLDRPIQVYNGAFRSPQVLIDGVAHWTACYMEYIPPIPCIVYFDFVQEKFGTIDLPKIIFEDWVLSIHVSKWHGFLSVASMNGCCGCPNTVDLWVMQNGSWSNMMRFDPVYHLPEALCVLEDRCRILAFTGDGDLVFYDHGNKEYIPLCSRTDAYVPLNLEECGAYPTYTFAYGFVESLVFPHQNCIVGD